MEKQLTKLDKIEKKTNDIQSEIQEIQKTVEGLQGEVEEVRNKVKSNEEEMWREISSLRSQLRSQESLFPDLANKVSQDVLQETKRHFNGFTKNIEFAFVKEQAATRRINLLFTGVREDQDKSDFRLINQLCSSSLGLRGVRIDCASTGNGQRGGGKRTTYTGRVQSNCRQEKSLAGQKTSQALLQ